MARRLTVTQCRSCCCGSTTKHPDVDHDSHAEQIHAAVRAGGVGRSRVAKCLDECERSNVVLVRRAAGTGEADDYIWLGPVNDDADLAVLTDWLRAGARGPLPEALQRLRFTKRPPRPPIAQRVAAGQETSLICPLSRTAAVHP